MVKLLNHAEAVAFLNSIPDPVVQAYAITGRTVASCKPGG